MIKQPNVILGNDDLLVTMGKKGEIIGFFTPVETMLSMSKNPSPVSIQEKGFSGPMITNGTASRII